MLLLIGNYVPPTNDPQIRVEKAVLAGIESQIGTIILLIYEKLGLYQVPRHLGS